MIILLLTLLPRRLATFWISTAKWNGSRFVSASLFVGSNRFHVFMTRKVVKFGHHIESVPSSAPLFIIPGV